MFGIIASGGLNDSQTTDEKTKQITADERQKQEEYFLNEYEPSQNIEDYKKQETTSIQKSKGLPTACNGVDSTETWLYPTAEKCMIELGRGYYAWCLSKEKKLAEKGAEARAGICMADIKIRLSQTCKDPVLSSPEVCMMSTMKNIYQQMILE